MISCHLLFIRNQEANMKLSENRCNTKDIPIPPGTVTLPMYDLGVFTAASGVNI